MANKKISDELWKITENKIDKDKLKFWETIFTLGNGYLGSRGILEENYKDGYAGTYLAGVYDKSQGISFEIVNAPNPIPIEIIVDGQKLCADEMEVLEHQRSLDIKKGLLIRRTLFKGKDGNRYEYKSMRFFSLADMNLGALQINFKSIDNDVDIVVRTYIDATTKNEIQPCGDPIKHYSIVDIGSEEKNLIYLLTKTNDLEILISFAKSLDVSLAGNKIDIKTSNYVNGDACFQESSFKAKKGKRYIIDNIISIQKSQTQDPKSLKIDCINNLENARKKGFNRLLTQHIRAWKKVWTESDIEITGDDFVQKALRFNIYHLLISAPFKDIDTSIAAKTLSGEWYKGHVFWDMDIYVLPLFIYSQPKIAKNLLLYRYRRLDAARENAKKQGYKGALWPWESAYSGKDETPDTWVNFDGSIIPVHNKEREHHIAADVIYGVFNYYKVTKDDDFIILYGAEMIFETARFWASRVIYNKKKKYFEIKSVIGPNEFQECVDNNSYTNALVISILKNACELYQKLQKKYPHKLKNITEKINLKSDELDTWMNISENILLLISSNGLIEEFEGYFNKRNITITNRDEKGMPVFPSEVELKNVKDTQLVKQADVILLLHLLSDEFSLENKKINFEYYDKRTLHKSSLSLVSYIMILIKLGNIEKAYNYFSLAIKADIGDIYKNTEQGIHAAALGGCWQIIINGFAGLKIKDDIVSLNPSLPEQWKKVKFKVWFKNTLIEFSITHKKITALIIKGRKEIDIEISDKICEISRRLFSKSY